MRTAHKVATGAGVVAGLAGIGYLIYRNKTVECVVSTAGPDAVQASPGTLLACLGPAQTAQTAYYALWAGVLTAGGALTYSVLQPEGV